MHDTMHRILWELAKVRQQSGMGTRHGYVHSVSESGGERKVRAVIGIKHDGSPLLSPWYHTEENRGGGRSQQHIKEGQNVILQSHGGDYRNGTLSPGPESTSFPQPSHAGQINGDTRQLGKVRESYNMPSDSSGGGGGSGGSGGGGGSGGSSQGGSEHFYENWIADSDDQNPQHQAQSGQPEATGGGGTSQQSSSGGQQQQQAKATSKFRHSEKGFLTGRVGNDDQAARFAAHEKGAKIRIKQHAIFVESAGPFSTKPLQIKPDTSIPNDNN